MRRPRRLKERSRNKKTNNLLVFSINIYFFVSQYGTHYEGAANHALAAFEVGGGDDDDEDEDEEEDEVVPQQAPVRYGVHKEAGVLQPLEPLQQPQLAGVGGGGGLHFQPRQDEQSDPLRRRQEVDRVFRRYHL